MSEQTVTLTYLKQHLGEVVNRAAYGNQRIILLSRGRPRAAIISLDDLEKLQILEQDAMENQEQREQLSLLSEMDELRAQMHITTDSVQVLSEIREERVGDLTNLP